MKNHKYSISILCTLILGLTLLNGQSTKNHVIEYTFRQEDTSVPSDVFTSPTSQVLTQITYFDGVGRPEQIVLKQFSPLGADLRTPLEYDAFGRQLKKYLPVPYASNIGAFVTNSTIISSGEGYYGGRFGTSDGLAAYSLTSFENSMLGRPLTMAAPGADWHNNTATYEYHMAESDEVKRWVLDDLQVSAESFFSINELRKNVTSDEDGNQTVEFIDRLGRTLLKKSQVSGSDEWAETYYIYDRWDRLRVVIPPQGNEAISDYYNGLTVDGFEVKGADHTVLNAEGNDKFAYTFDATITIPPNVILTDGFVAKPIEVLTPEFLDDWAFQYEYDDLGRMTSKKVPGAEEVLMVYDQWDRLVLTQDGNQRAVNQWLFTKYDALNRPVLTGLKVIPGSETSVRNAVEASSARYETYNGAGTYGYNNASYPNATDFLTVTYYDDYDFKALWSESLNFTNPSTPALTQNPAVKGQITGTMTKYGTSWIRSVSYYDDKYRAIQIQSTNHLDTNGKDVVTNYYDFIGQLDKTISTHYDGSETTKITRSFEYDHTGRLLKTFHQIGDNAADKKLIAFKEYNELGELIEKNLHHDGGLAQPADSDFEQSVDYDYNIRGWLTSINDSGLSESGDLFGMELYYNTSAGLSGQTTVFNGNISAAKWSDQDMSALGISARGYTYTYDKLNRLTGANHFENGSSSNRYKVTGLSYDLNGNIKTLKRQDESTSTSNFMDNLTYAYTGNQLTKVDDSGDDTEGFTETTTGTDYAYDANGNMISDNNKGITDIDYNHLNLPTEVTMSGSGNRIEYLYDAAGIKLQQKVYESSALTKTTDYVGEFIYETLGTGNRELQLIQHEEGRIIFEEFGQDWDYQYHLKDHLGNTRLTFSTLSQDPLVAVETFETGEDNGFQDLHRHTNSNANTTAGGNEVERLLSGQTGAMALVGVNKNDVVSLSVQANYESAPSGNSYAAISSLFSSFDGTYGTVEGGGFTSSATEFQDAINGMTAKGSSSSAPRAFLNYIFFDLDMNYVGSGFEQVTTAALGTGNHDLVEINNYIPNQDGYMLVYLSNENSQVLTMHFDDFTITQVKTNIVQADDYYPFGLTFNSYTRTASTAQNFKFGGKECQEETDWLDFGARMYMPEIGRWGVADPLASIKPNWTPYRYAFNNPLRYVDPTGLIEIDQIMNIFNNAPSGVSSYDGDGQCTCGCPGKPPCKDEKKAFQGPQGLVVGKILQETIQGANWFARFSPLAFLSLSGDSDREWPQSNWAGQEREDYKRLASQSYSSLSDEEKRYLSYLEQYYQFDSNGEVVARSDSSNFVYEANPKHGNSNVGKANKAPENPEWSLQNSYQLSGNTTRRVGADKTANEFNVFDEHSPGKFHGHSRNWNELNQDMKNTLIRNGATNRKGKILK